MPKTCPHLPKTIPGCLRPSLGRDVIDDTILEQMFSIFVCILVAPRAYVQQHVVVTPLLKRASRSHVKQGFSESADAAPPTTKNTSSEALSEYTFVIFHIKVRWGTTV